MNEFREFEMLTLPNGIRVVHKEISHTRITHCGFFLDIGSRDEGPLQQGLAHFWEHMAFKGTRRRKAFHILNRLDSVGGELNAYTTKEKICFYASSLTEYFPKAFDLLTDITFDSIFPEKQIENERKVILEEMAMYFDSPEDAIQDEFDDVVFQGHSMGRNILGTEESIRSFQKKDFKNFIQENLDTSRIIFVSVGNLSFKKVVKLAEKYLKDIPVHSNAPTRKEYDSYKPSFKKEYRNLTQSHAAIGRTAFSLNDENRVPFSMIINLLGGPGMNSRLNLAAREKYGYVYSIDATYHPFTDTGMWGIYFGTDPDQLQKVYNLVLKELRRLKEKPLGAIQLHKAKEQIMGQLAMSEENNLSLMLLIGRALLDLDQVPTMKEIFSRIEKVNADQIVDISREMFDETTISSLFFLPRN